MISKDLIAASSKALILAFLSKQESYGYEIIKNIQEISNNQIVWKELNNGKYITTLCSKLNYNYMNCCYFYSL